jgi:predicted small lipoprotein YifL
MLKLRQLLPVALITLSSLTLAACGPKKPVKVAPTPTPTPRLVEMPVESRPYVSLIPRADGHELKLKITNIKNIDSVEYELLYLASDEGNEIEKGVGDSLKITGSSIERDLLLGTASCTNGCKYKYDANVHGGTLKLTFTTQEGQIATYETPFALVTGADWKKTPVIIDDNQFTIAAAPTSAAEFFVVTKNYGFPSGSSGKLIYSN